MEAPVELFRSLSGAVSVFHEHLLASTAVPVGSVWLAILSQVLYHALSWMFTVLPLHPRPFPA
jgi:hypothetical protein